MWYSPVNRSAGSGFLRLEDLISDQGDIALVIETDSMSPDTRFFHFLAFRLPHLEKILPFAISRPVASILVPILSNSLMLPTGIPSRTHFDLTLHLPIPLLLP